MTNNNITNAISRLEQVTDELSNTVAKIRRRNRNRKDLPKSSGVYEIEVVTTGEKYVGSANEIRSRIITHFSQMRTGVHPNHNLQSVFDTYGEEAFRIAVIDLIEDREDRLDREQELLDLEDEYKLNIYRSSRGRKGLPHTRATKKKMSESKTGELHPKFKGIYKTPWGEFTSPYAASLECPDKLISHTSITLYCESSDTKINRAVFGQSRYLRTYFNETVIGRSWSDVGFSFEAATKH